MEALGNYWAAVLWFVLLVKMVPSKPLSSKFIDSNIRFWDKHNHYTIYISIDIHMYTFVH